MLIIASAVPKHGKKSEKEKDSMEEIHEGEMPEMAEEAPMEEAEQEEEEAPEEEAPAKESDDTPEAALEAAIKEHGPDDAGQLVSWLQEYGFELTKSEGAPEEEAPEEEGEEEPMGGAEAFGFDPHTMRNSAAKRAFSKHYGGK